MTGVEAPGSLSLAGRPVTRPEEGDLYLSACAIRRQAPMSMFWQSNGGRDYAAVVGAAYRLPRRRGRARGSNNALPVSTEKGHLRGDRAR